jgi:lactoylglutathione lyase
MSAITLTTGHIGLNVTDLKRSTEFYSSIFGLAILSSSDAPGREFAFLGAGNNVVLTLWKQSKGPHQTGVPGLHHLSFQAGSMEQVREAERRLRERRAKIYHDGIVAHGENTSSGGIFFEDPDGIRLEIFAASGAEQQAPAYAGVPSCGFF